MKKAVSLVMALVVCLTLSACASEKKDSPTKSSATGNETSDGSTNSSEMLASPENSAQSSTMTERGDSAPGDFTVTDQEGNVYTLSNSILYTVSVSELTGVQELDTEGFFDRIKEDVSIIYAIPHDTLITAPNGIRFDSVMGTFIEEKDGAFCTIAPIGPGPGWTEFQLEEGWEGALFMLPCYTTNEAEPDISVDFVDNIAFFVPLDEAAGNPF